jgi:hypothetical protein
MRSTWLLLLVLVVLWAPDAATGQGVFGFHDLRTAHLPWRVWAAGEWAQGRLPLWCDGVGNGFPLTADGQTGAFYPPTMLLFLVLPPGVALGWALLAHVWIAGVGTFLLARALGRSREAALLAAIAFAFSGFLATHAHYLGMQNAVAWLPWALWALHGERRAALAGAVFFLLVAGHIEAAVFALAMVLVCALAWRRGATLAFGLGVGVLLASPQLFATAELTRQSLRAGGVSPAFAATGSLPVQEILNGVLPKLFGFDRPADVRESYFQRGPHYWGQGTSHWEMAFYLGVPVVFLAASTLPMARQLRLWWGLVAGALVLMLGEHTPVWPALRRLPGLDHFRFPVRFSFVLTLATAVLAAHGLDRVTALAADRQRRLGRTAWIAAGVFAAAVVMGHFALEHAAPALERALTDHFVHRIPRTIDPTSLQALMSPGPEPMGRAVIEERVATVLRSLDRSTSIAAPQAIVPVLALGAIGLGLTALARGRIAPSGFAMLVSALLTIDLFWFGSEYQARVSARFLGSQPRALAVIDPADGRATVVDRRQDPALDVELLSANLGLLHGTRDVIVPSPLLLPANELLLAKTGLDVGDKGIAKVARLEAHPGLVDLLGVRWLLSTHELPRFVERQSGPVRVYENTAALPPAFVVGCIEQTSDAVAALGALDPRRWAIVETEVPVPDCREGPIREAVTDRPRSGEVRVTATGPGLLVLTDSWYPGWRATVDGTESAIVRADATFRGVVVGEGRHQVVFRYRPAWLPWSAALAGVGLAVLAWRTIHGAKTTG